MKSLKVRIKLTLGLWASRIRKLIIGPYATHVLVTSLNGRMLVPASDFNVGRKLAFKGEYDREHIERISALVNQNSRVLIVGAHVGCLVVPISRLVKEIVAIEANPQTFEVLRLNLTLNNCQNVRALNVAASDQDEKVAFLASKHNSGGSKIAPKERRLEFFYDSPDVVQVRAARLDDLLLDFAPSHIIMDIEGAEAKALAGMQRLMRSCDVLLVEFVPNHIENIAGISCSEFIGLLPFKNMRLIDDPDEKDVIQRARSEYYYGGADLLCRRDRVPVSAN